MKISSWVSVRAKAGAFTQVGFINPECPAGDVIYNTHIIGIGTPNRTALVKEVPPFE